MENKALLFIIIVFGIVASVILLSYIIDYWINPFRKKYRGNEENWGLYKGKDGYGQWHVGYLQQSFGVIRQCVRIRPLGLLRLLPPCDIFGKVLIQKGTLCACSEFYDSKENPIYESDILRLTEKNLTSTGIVRFGEYSDSHYGWYIEIAGKNIAQQPLLLWINKNDKACEVIGNIFDTPELLPRRTDENT